jgi:hypothetical protein
LEKRHPPANVRDKLDLGYRIDGQSVVIYETRTRWDNPDVFVEAFVAKATYVKSKKIWKIFWVRQDLKWHSYPHCPIVENIEDFFNVICLDERACFFG